MTSCRRRTCSGRRGPPPTSRSHPRIWPDRPGLRLDGPPGGADQKVTVAAVLCVAFARPRSGGGTIGFRGGGVTGCTAARRGPDALAAPLDTLPDGVVVVDADWTIVYVNPAGAALVGRPAAELTGRGLCGALPEASGTILHTFLLHARGAGAPVTWQGFYAPTGRWLTATAVVVGDLLQVSFREIADQLHGRADERTAAPDEETGDRARLRYLAEVSEAMIATLDTAESAARLAELAVRRLCDWAVVALTGEDGGPGEQASAHGDPARRADLGTYLRGRLPDTGDDVALVRS